ncbi:MAG: archease [archaeon]
MVVEYLEHTADIKFKVIGNSYGEIFSEAVYALNETIRGEIRVSEREEKKINANGYDMVSLLHNFLEEFLYLLEAEEFLVARIKEIKIDLENFKLESVVVGDKAKNYKFTNNVKAVTYSEMYVSKENDKFVCQVVLDV